MCIYSKFHFKRSRCSTCIAALRLLVSHLPEEKQHGGSTDCCSICKHPPYMREDIRITAAEHGPFHLYRMHERKHVCDLSEYTAYEIQIEPDSGQPRCQIREQRPADAADLLYSPRAMKNSETGITNSIAYTIVTVISRPSITAAI